MKRILRTMRWNPAMTAALLLAAMIAGPARAADCDRPCLEGMLTRYLDAVAARNPSELPLASGARFTEDSQELKLGEGLWKTVTRKGDYRQDYLDVKRQIAATHAVLYEEQIPVLYSVLLRIVDEKINGIETLIYRVLPDSRFQPVMLTQPLAGLNASVPADQRPPREDLVRIAMTYPDGLRIGSFVEAKVPFAERAYRVENGTYMAGKTECPREECPDILTQSIIKHPDIETSLAAVDEELGIVLLWMNFGFTNSYGPGKALVTFEAFKVQDGKIQVVNAFFNFLPQETRRGWPALE